jgi:hypothetical protein
LSGDVSDSIRRFFAQPPPDCGRISNERALQLELALYLRRLGWCVEFEIPLSAPRHPNSTLRPKRNLDLMVRVGSCRIGIELKVPLNGQHPETMYAFCADLEFIEALKRAGHIDLGFCLMATNDPVFWTDSGRGSPIHNLFRGAGRRLAGRIERPTGAKDSCVHLEGEYCVSANWLQMSDNRLLKGGRYALIAV